MALRRAREHGVEMPITEAVVAVLEGEVTPAHALERLMGARRARRILSSASAARQPPPA